MDYDKLFNQVRARREPLGLNVRFLRADGTEDEFSFRDQDRVERFKASLRRQNLTILN